MLLTIHCFHEPDWAICSLDLISEILELFFQKIDVKSNTRKSTSKISNIKSDDINKNVYSPQGSKIRREKWIYSNSKKSFPGLSNVSMFLSSSSRLFPIRRKLLIENYLTLIPFLQEIVFFVCFYLDQEMFSAQVFLLLIFLILFSQKQLASL